MLLTDFRANQNEVAAYNGYTLVPVINYVATFSHHQVGGLDRKINEFTKLYLGSRGSELEDIRLLMNVFQKYLRPKVEYIPTYKAAIAALKELEIPEETIKEIEKVYMPEQAPVMTQPFAVNVEEPKSFFSANLGMQKSVLGLESEAKPKSRLLTQLKKSKKRKKAKKKIR